MGLRELCLGMYSSGMVRGIEDFCDNLSMVMDAEVSDVYTKEKVKQLVLMTKSVSFNGIPDDEVRKENFDKSYFRGYLDSAKESSGKVISAFEPMTRVQTPAFISDVKKVLEGVKDDLNGSKRVETSDYDIGWNQNMDYFSCTVFPLIEGFFGNEVVVSAEKVQELIDTIRTEIDTVLGACEEHIGEKTEDDVKFPPLYPEQQEEKKREAYSISLDEIVESLPTWKCRKKE